MLCRFFTLALLLPLFGKSAAAQACAATPEAAARETIGVSDASRANLPNGFRVVDVQVDAAMKRLWVRVRRCDAPSAPLVLVPLRADLAGDAQRPQAALSSLSAVPWKAAEDRSQPIAVRPGDAVTVVFASQSVRMTMQGTASRQGSLGETIEVALAARDGEASHRIRGIVRADHRVEVQP